MLGYLDGANYWDFVQHMRIHICKLRLWCILSNDISCLPSPVLLTELLQPSVDKAAIEATTTAYDKVVPACQDA